MMTKPDKFEVLTMVLEALADARSEEDRDWVVKKIEHFKMWGDLDLVMRLAVPLPYLDGALEDAQREEKARAAAKPAPKKVAKKKAVGKAAKKEAAVHGG